MSAIDNTSIVNSSTNWLETPKDIDKREDNELLHKISLFDYANITGQANIRGGGYQQ